MKVLLTIFFTAVIAQFTMAQNAAIDSSKYPRLSNFTADQNQENMMKQLGIQAL